MPDWAIWILVGLAFGVLEIATVSFFGAFFALGALLTALLALFTDDWTLQALVFAGASVMFVYLLRPILFRGRGPEQQTAVDRMIGSVGIVVQAIDNHEGVGQVKVKGEVWTARSSDGAPIAVGCRVRVMHIDGVKVIVLETQEQIKRRQD